MHSALPFVSAPARSTVAAGAAPTAERTRSLAGQNGRVMNGTLIIRATGGRQLVGAAAGHAQLRAQSIARRVQSIDRPVGRPNETRANTKRTTAKSREEAPPPNNKLHAKFRVNSREWRRRRRAECKSAPPHLRHGRSAPAPLPLSATLRATIYIGTCRPATRCAAPAKS